MQIERITGVLVCGNISLDMPVWPVEKLRWGTTTWVEAITESPGGNGANTSYALATLGVPVRLSGTVGLDDNGDKLLTVLEGAGVDVSRVRRSEMPTTTTIAIVHPSGDRLFLQKTGSSGDVDPDTIVFDDIAGFSHFHLGNPFTLPKVRLQTGPVMQRAKAAGLTTSLDTGWDARGRWIEDIGPCLPYTDLFFLNDAEAGMLTGGIDNLDEAVNALRQLGATDMVIKTGPKGCVLYLGSSKQAVPGYSVPAVDSTGSGDCFAGGFLAALARDQGYKDAAAFANAVGALNVQKLGAAQGVLPYEATLDWMRKQSKL